MSNAKFPELYSIYNLFKPRNGFPPKKEKIITKISPNIPSIIIIKKGLKKSNSIKYFSIISVKGTKNKFNKTKIYPTQKFVIDTPFVLNIISNIIIIKKHIPIINKE